MGLFGRKEEPTRKPPIDESSDGVQRFFDGYFAELRLRGREHFDKLLEEHSEEFKQDLSATIAKADSGLKEHIAQQLDEKITENNQIIRDAEEHALQTVTTSAKSLEERHAVLAESLQNNIAEQQVLLVRAFEENKAQLAAMKEAQAAALQWLNQSAQAMQSQQEHIAQTLQKNVATQEATIIAAFEENMAQVVEHYLLEALGDQYDLKAQLPTIIKQMEASKQDMMDDMKL